MAKTIIVKVIKGTLILETKWKVKVIFGNSFYFLFKKKIGNIKKKQFSYIFEIKNMFG